jgi:hypothetical protein
MNISNKKNVQFIALTALLAANAVQANDSWPQRLIGGLVVGSAVTGAAIAQGTAQRYMTLYGIGPKTLTETFEHSYGPATKETHLLASKSYSMSSYKQAVLLYSAGIGSIATVAACLGSSPLDVSDVMKPVIVGMGVIGASYFAGALRGYNEFNTRGDLKRYAADESNCRRYLAARTAYRYASTITPFVVAGVGGYMIYDRCARS